MFTIPGPSKNLEYLLEQVEKAVASLTDPITGSPSYGQAVSGGIYVYLVTFSV